MKNNDCLEKYLHMNTAVRHLFKQNPNLKRGYTDEYIISNQIRILILDAERRLERGNKLIDCEGIDAMPSLLSAITILVNREKAAEIAATYILNIRTEDRPMKYYRVVYLLAHLPSGEDQQSRTVYIGVRAYPSEVLRNKGKMIAGCRKVISVEEIDIDELNARRREDPQSVFFPKSW